MNQVFCEMFMEKKYQRGKEINLPNTQKTFEYN